MRTEYTIDFESPTPLLETIRAYVAGQRVGYRSELHQDWRPLEPGWVTSQVTEFCDMVGITHLDSVFRLMSGWYILRVGGLTFDVYINYANVARKEDWFKGDWEYKPNPGYWSLDLVKERNVAR
jgi:hypothetical protein